MTSVYKVRGFEDTDVDAAFQAFATVLACSAVGIDAVCASVHSNSLDVMSRLSSELGGADVSAFVWKRFPVRDIERLPELGRFAAAKIVQKSQTVTVVPHWELPAYDWDETPPTVLCATLERRVSRSSGALSYIMQPDAGIAEEVRRRVTSELRGG